MDFDSAITFVLFLLFFILPSILKQVKARKEKSTQKKQVKKATFFTKIGEQVQKFVRELEQQAQQQRQTAKTEENVWETLSEDEGERYYEADGTAEFYEEDESGFEPDFDSKPVPATEPFIKPEPELFESSGKGKRLLENELQSMEPQPRVSARFRNNQLQNAIVWSEILSKPVALRDGNR